MPLHLHNTLTRRTEPFIPADPANVTFYSCGPTVYDDAHIGNFRSFLAADVLRRWIESPLCELTAPDGSPHRGPRRVTHVMNITDVGHMTDDSDPSGGGEDKMQQAARRLLEAKKAGKLPADAKIDPSDPYAIAEFYAQRFLEDARTLGLQVALDAQGDPSLMPRPTQKVPAMIAMIEALIARGCAYAVGEPGRQTVYFDVASFPPYGRLSGNTLDAVRAGAGGRVSDTNQSEKKHPADFMLWKADPSHVMKWPSPWGEGYPGWHIECSVMARERLGDEIDLHSGGEDNIFPHHECEIAQSCCATGHERFARLWFHARHLFVEGAKMSKSKGNFFTARDFFAKGVEPAALRLELIGTHYRSNADFTMQSLEDRQRTVDRWRSHAKFLSQILDEPWPASQLLSGTTKTAQSFLEEFSEALNSDLNIAKAVATVNEFMGARGFFTVAADVWKAVYNRDVRTAWSEIDSTTLAESPLPPSEAMQELARGEEAGTFRQAWAALHLVDNVLGVIFAPAPKSVKTDIGVFTGGLAPDPTVIAKLEERAAARKAKDFARSDAIRDELLKMGYAIKDVAGGKVEVSRA